MPSVRPLEPACVVTLVVDRAASCLSAALVARVRDALAAGLPEVLSPGEAIDLPCSTAPDPATIAAALSGEAVDAVVVPRQGRRKALLVADMDSTIVQKETLDELARVAGCHQEVAALTRMSMDGEVDFTLSLRRRVALLQGVALAALEETWRRVVLTDGAGELVATMRAHGAWTALVSGGFTFFTGRVASRLGFHEHHANALVHDGLTLTGAVADPVLDRDAKLETLRRLADAHGVGLEATLAVGDGANDVAMLSAAGLGVAFHARPVVAAKARARIDHAGLRALLFVQGYHAAEIVA